MYVNIYKTDERVLNRHKLNTIRVGGTRRWSFYAQQFIQYEGAYATGNKPPRLICLYRCFIERKY